MSDNNLVIQSILRRLDVLEESVEAMNNPSGEIEEPPLPPKVSRKYQGGKVDIRPRIDSVLFDLLTADAHRQSGGNISRQLDIILWRYYNKPKLSFELKDDNEKDFS